MKLWSTYAWAEDIWASTPPESDKYSADILSTMRIRLSQKPKR